MATPLTVLIAADQTGEVDLLMHTLRVAGFDVTAMVVATEADYLARLAADPDLILVSLSLVQFSGPRALELLHARALDIPLIVIAESANEAAAVQCMHQGAADYLVNDRLARLGPAVQRVLEPKHDRAQQYLDVAGVILVVLDAAGKVQLINRRGCDILGYDEAEIKGQEWFANFVPEDMRATVHAVFKRFISGEIAISEFERYENEVLLHSGETRLIGWYNTLLTDDDGHIIGTLSSGEDITDRRRAQAAEREQREFAEALSTVAAILNSALDIDVVIERILASVGRVVPHDAANVMLIEDGHVHVVGHRGYAERGLKDWIESLHWPLDEVANFREVAASGQPMIIPEVQNYAAWKYTPETVWIGSFVNAPIIQDSAVIGFLNLDKGERSFYTAEHAQRLMAFANQAAVALKNAHLHEAVQRYAADLEQRVRVRTAELRESEARYRAIVEDQTELIMRFVDDWALTFVNQAFLRYFGTTAEAMIGASFMPLLHDDDRERVALTLHALSAEDPVVTLECRVIMPGAVVRWVQWTNRMIVDEQGQFVEFQSTGRDITERRKAEDVLHKSLVREIHLSELKSRFVSLVSHEFRNPLAVILMNNDILQRYHDRLTPEQREEYHQGIRAHVQQMTELLEDLLLVSQSEAGRLEVKPEVVDLVPSTQRIVDEVWTTGGADRALLLTMPDDCVTRTDPKLFRLIMVNLVSNAAKYTREGGKVAVHLSCTPDQVVFSVQDDGIGIPETDQLRLYETFHRGNNVGSRKGTGLGLALVKQCVEQLGGTIAFHSEENIGTTFTVILPRTDALPSSGIEGADTGDHTAR